MVGFKVGIVGGSITGCAGRFGASRVCRVPGRPGAGGQGTQPSKGRVGRVPAVAAAAGPDSPRTAIDTGPWPFNPCSCLLWTGSLERVRQADPVRTSLSVPLFAFRFSCGALFSYMSTTHEPLFARASRTRAPENADSVRPGTASALWTLARRSSLSLRRSGCAAPSTVS